MCVMCVCVWRRYVCLEKRSGVSVVCVVCKVVWCQVDSFGM